MKLGYFHSFDFASSRRDIYDQIIMVTSLKTIILQKRWQSAWLQQMTQVCTRWERRRREILLQEMKLQLSFLQVADAAGQVAVGAGAAAAADGAGSDDAENQKFKLSVLFQHQKTQQPRLWRPWSLLGWEPSFSTLSCSSSENQLRLKVLNFLACQSNSAFYFIWFSEGGAPGKPVRAPASNLFTDGMGFDM